MSFKFQDGAFVLLCPCGEGYSTVSQEDYDFFVAAEALNESGTMREVSKAVFGNWICNVKELTIDSKVQHHYPGGQFPDDETTGSQVETQWHANPDTGLTDIQNTTKYPCPLLKWVFDLDEKGRLMLINLEKAGGGDDFAYATDVDQTPTGVMPFPGRFFIWDDVFYIFVGYRNSGEYSTTLDIATDQITLTEIHTTTYVVTTYTLEYKITKTYY